MKTEAPVRVIRLSGNVPSAERAVVFALDGASANLEGASGMPPTVKAIVIEYGDPEQMWSAIADRGQPLSIRLGRGDESDMVVPKSVAARMRNSVSRVHARVVRRGSEFWIEDLGSSNFTYVDGQVALWPMRIALPCTLRLGDLPVRIRRASVTADALEESRSASLAQSGTAPPVTECLRLPWEKAVHAGPKQSGKFRLAGALIHLAEFAAKPQRADDAETALRHLMAMYLSAANVVFALGVRDAEVKDALVKGGVTKSCADLIYNQIQTTPPYEYLVRVFAAKERALAWVLRSSNAGAVSVLAASGIRTEGSAFDVEEMDVVVGMALRMAAPLLDNLRELEAHRAATTSIQPHDIDETTAQTCERLQFWGKAPAFRRALYYAEQGARRYLPAKQGGQKLSVIFVRGESGTGKSLLARLIHELSDRAGAPFEEINCAAVPITLAESELFGYERGAHDTAYTAKPGIFEAAANGTLFLDEIGKTSRDFQAKLLKVLDTGTLRRLGGKQSLRTACYVIIAASEDPAELCKKGLLLEELWFRTGAFMIPLPALRERADDIPLLIGKELETLNAPLPPAEHRPLSRRLRAALERHDWPGNVRQLLEYVDVLHAVAPRGAAEIDLAHVPAHMQIELGLGPEGAPLNSAAQIDTTRPLDDLVNDLERNYLVRMIVECNGNLSDVARKSGKSYQTIYNKLKRIREWIDSAAGNRHAELVQQLRDAAGPHWPIVSQEPGAPLPPAG